MKKIKLFATVFICVLAVAINFSKFSSNFTEDLSISELTKMNQANAEISFTWDDMRSVYSWIDDKLIPGDWYGDAACWWIDGAEYLLDGFDLTGDPVPGIITYSDGSTGQGIVDECDGQPNSCGGGSPV